MISDQIHDLFKTAKRTLVVRGLLGLALGIVILVRPMESVAALALVIAIWALVDGIVNIAHAFEFRGIAQHWWVLLLGGIVSVAFGIFALYYYPGLSLVFAVVWAAAWLLTGGAIGMYATVRERQIGLQWGWTLVFSLLAIVVGVLALMYPNVTLAVLLAYLATFGIVGGVMLLIAAGRMSSAERQVRERVEGRPAKAA